METIVMHIQSRSEIAMQFPGHSLRDRPEDMASSESKQITLICITDHLAVYIYAYVLLFVGQACRKQVIPQQVLYLIISCAF